MVGFEPRLIPDGRHPVIKPLRKRRAISVGQEMGKGAALRVLEPDVTTAGDLGRLVVTVLGMVADLELKFIRDRQRAGIDAAKAKGAIRGGNNRSTRTGSGS
ncbi:MAG: recombinase family protein [Rhodobacteraceae bacterium]|nr:recombinase family protein [Paracoccaceae bacterium]MCY4195779.1 recombinase family protein [Paracoccaceae bacterium]MCY4327530.1 recombinase family protein [Paracoccaceae bacterium]